MNEKRAERGRDLIAITGATGTVGRRVVAQLAAAGHGCRAVVRDASKSKGILGPEAEIATDDFSRPETLGTALAGAQRLFLLAPDAPGAEKLELEANAIENAFYLPTADGTVSGIDPDDIAVVAAEALIEDGHEGKAYTLTGPEALSHAEQAAQLSAALGRQVAYVDIPRARPGRQCARPVHHARWSRTCSSSTRS